MHQQQQQQQQDESMSTLPGSAGETVDAALAVKIFDFLCPDQGYNSPNRKSCAKKLRNIAAHLDSGLPTKELIGSVDAF